MPAVIDVLRSRLRLDSPEGIRLGEPRAVGALTLVPAAELRSAGEASQSE